MQPFEKIGRNPKYKSFLKSSRERERERERDK
jgi:hypothetical protein